MIDIFEMSYARGKSIIEKLMQQIFKLLISIPDMHLEVKYVCIRFWASVQAEKYVLTLCCCVSARQSENVGCN